MKKSIFSAAVLATMGCSAASAQVFPENLSIKPYLNITAGTFYSKKSYDGVSENSKNWQEAYAKYGFEGEYKLNGSVLNGSIKGLSSGTFSDGDASGFTNGKERRTSLEEWTVGWRNGSAEDAKIDLSLGRQSVQVGDGFIVAADPLNLGKGAGELNRGGAYYLAARQSFDFTTVLHYQLTDNLKTHWFYLESDTKAQHQPTLWSTDWQYHYANTDFGATFLQIIDVEDPLKETGRDQLKDYAVRAKKQVNEQLNLSAEYVYQEQKSDDENAWYTAVNYTFDQLPFQPTLGYRYSSFSEHYDTLFYGITDAGLGTWFQGEVAGNYAGPYNMNARIQQVSLQADVRESLHVGVLAYQFDTIKKANENLGARELDIFAVWSPTKNINVIPLVGFYKPKKDAANGGTQMGDTSTNTYAQLMLQYMY